jgi:hypothetical protein
MSQNRDMGHPVWGGRSIKQVSPLRCAPVEMTKGVGVLRKLGATNASVSAVRRVCPYGQYPT